MEDSEIQAIEFAIRQLKATLEIGRSPDEIKARLRISEGILKDVLKRMNNQSN